MKLLYVSGKYTDSRGPYFQHENIMEARRVAALLWAFGIPVLCPHINSYHLDGVIAYDKFIAGDLLMVERCDALVALPSYAISQGSQREIKRNEEIGHPRFNWAVDMPKIVDFAVPEGLTKQAYAMAFQLTRGDECAYLNRCRHE